MLTESQYNVLSSELASMTADMVPHWGHVQNDRYDSCVNMFAADSRAALEGMIAHLDDDHKNYLRRRWFLWKCSQCDEYLFCLAPNAEPNPNPRDKSYDVRIKGKVDFDLKGTVIPKVFMDSPDLFMDPLALIDYLYDHQSSGVRYGVQNRLFLAHFALDDAMELRLRTAWDIHAMAFRYLCVNLDFRYGLFDTHGVKAQLIYFLEIEPGRIDFIIGRAKKNLG